MTKLNFIGFHATSEKSGKAILKEEFIINKARDNEWLGYGIYLFKYKSDAFSWTKSAYYCKPNPVIIKCLVEVEEEKYLDLDNPDELYKYNQYFEEVLDLLSKSNKSVKFKDNKEAMCFGLNIYKEACKIDLIKYTFHNNRTRNAMKYGKNEYGYKYNEVQLCVTTNKPIVKKEICS